MKIAFISVNYNNYMVSLNYVYNVMNIARIDKHDYKIVIVDNASRKDDYEALKKAMPNDEHVMLVESDKNLGYFGGLNLGIKALNYQEYDYILISNNDIMFKPDFCEVLESKKYKNDEIVIVPTIETLDGKNQNPQMVNKPSKKRIFGYDLYYSNYYIAIIVDWLYGGIRRKKKHSYVPPKEQKHIYLCTGACMLLTKEFLNRCGLLDSKVFMWGEEAVLAHQIEEAGGKMLYDPDLYILHFESATIKKVASRKKYELRKQSYKIYREFYVSK